MVIGDFPVADDDPMRKQAARGLVEAEAHDFALGEDRLVEGRDVSRSDVIDKLLPVGLKQIDHGRAADCARGVAADGRMQGADADLASNKRRHRIEHLVHGRDGWLMPRRDRVQHRGERSNLSPLAVEGRGLEPGIFALVLEVRVLRLRLSLVGVQRAVLGIGVPGVLDGFLDALAEEIVAEALDGLIFGQVAAGDVPAGIP